MFAASVEINILPLFLLLSLFVIVDGRLTGSTSFPLIFGFFNRNTNETFTNDTKPVIIQATPKIAKIVAVTFINGIYHTKEDWQRITRQLQLTFRVDVKPFYNPSSGWWVKDISKAGFDLVLRPNDLFLAKGLADHFRDVLRQLDPALGRIFHIAHSGGAILTYLAAKHHLSRAESNRIDICTFGGGKSITHKYFKGRIRNYYSRNDPLTLVDRRASTLLRQNINGTMVEVQDPKHNTTFVFMEPLDGNPIEDHSMEGLTYKLALEYEAEELWIRAKELQILFVKEHQVVRRLRKISANVTGIHHFFDLMIPSTVQATGRSVRKGFATATGMRGFFSRKYSQEQQNAGMLDEGGILDAADQRSEQLLLTNNEVISIDDENESSGVSVDELQYSLSR